MLASSRPDQTSWKKSRASRARWLRSPGRCGLGPRGQAECCKQRHHGNRCSADSAAHDSPLCQATGGGATAGIGARLEPEFCVSPPARVLPIGDGPEATFRSACFEFHPRKTVFASFATTHILPLIHGVPLPRWQHGETLIREIVEDRLTGHTDIGETACTRRRTRSPLAGDGRGSIKPNAGLHRPVGRRTDRQRKRPRGRPFSSTGWSLRCSCPRAEV